MTTVEQRGGVFRKGHLVMVAAIPNAGKSTFAEWLAANVAWPTLYFSADQDAWTSTTKLIAALTGEDANRVALNLNAGEGEGYYEDILEKSPIQFCFDSNPSLEDMGHEMDAYVETWDSYPDVIVVDNLVNIQGEGDKSSDMFILSELHGLARKTKACVVVLVHASEASTKDPLRPPTRKDIINKLSVLPDMVLTVAYDPERSIFYIAVVKTREAKADPNADHPVAITADFSRVQFGLQAAAPTWGWGGNDG